MGNLPSFALEEKRTEVRERSTPHDLRHIREKVGRLPGENFIRDCLEQTQKEEKSFVTEKKRKTSSKFNRKSTYHQVVLSKLLSPSSIKI
ncbi:UNVERIFIED_CONTAM: hypothetical protein NCL1_16125 [Trichonephila clavipes]